MLWRTFILSQHLLDFCLCVGDWLDQVMLQCRSAPGSLCKLPCWLTQGNNNVGTKFNPGMGTLFQLWGSWDLTVSDLSTFQCTCTLIKSKNSLSVVKTTFYGSQGERHKRIMGQTNLVWERAMYHPNCPSGLWTLLINLIHLFFRLFPLASGTPSGVLTVHCWHHTELKCFLCATASGSFCLWTLSFSSGRLKADSFHYKEQAPGLFRLLLPTTGKFYTHQLKLQQHC